MGIVFRQSAKNAIIIVSGAVLGAFVMLLYAQYFPNKHQVGFIQQFMVVGVSFSQLLLLGLSSTLAVYIHQYANDLIKKKLLISFCLFIPIVLTVVATILYFFFRHEIINWFQLEDRPFISRYFNWLPLYTLFFLFQLLMEQYLASQMKVAIAAFIREIILRLINIALLILYAYSYIDFDVFIPSIVLMYLVYVVVLLILSSKTDGFGFSLRFKKISKEEYLEISKFSWYHFLLNLSIMFMAYMDILLLPIYDRNGLESSAIYRFAAFLIVVLQMPLKALTPASFTALAKAFNDKDIVKAKDFFSRSSTNIFIPTVCFAILLFCNLNNIVSVLKNNYSGIIPIFSILFIGNIVNISTGMNDQVLSITNYYKFNFYLSFSLIIILYFLLRSLIPHYGIYGAAWSNTIIVIIFNVIKYLFIKKKLDMQPINKNTVMIILAALPSLVLGYFFPYFFETSRHIYIHTFMDVAMRSSVIIIVYILMLYWLKPSKDLQEYLVSIKKNKRLF